MEDHTGRLKLRSKKLGLFALMCFAALTAEGQERSKNEIGLLLGATVTPAVQTEAPGAGRLSIGSGITFQLNYARRLVTREGWVLYFEVPAVAVPLQEIRASAGAVPKNYDSFFVTPAARLTFTPGSKIAPWVSAGGGYALFDESAERMDGSHNVTRGISGGAAQFGGGVDMALPFRVLLPIGLRGEVRDFYTSKPNYNATNSGLQHNLVFSGGIVLHF